MVDMAKVREIIERHGCAQENIIAMLLDCQEEFYHIPREVIEEIATRVGIPRAKVLGIATFFRAFSLKPVGKHPIHVCMGTACHVKGAPRLLDAFLRELGVQRTQEVTPDNLFSVDTVNCLGCCGLAPVVTVGRDVHGKLKQSDVARLIKKYRAKDQQVKEG